MATPSLIFCGSFQEYSAMVLQGLLAARNLEVAAVITTPAHETKNPVQELAEFKGLPVFTPKVLDQVSLAEIENQVGQPTLLVTAGYGKLLPETWLQWPSLAALNLHFSLLPQYRGANPAEWAILCGETETGVTLIEMSPEFDTGKMVAQAALPITKTETRETAYHKLYTLGGEALPAMVTEYVTFRETGSGSKNTTKISYYWPPQSQPQSSTPYATRFKRDDGFIDWRAVAAALKGDTAGYELASLRLQQILAYSNQELDATFIERAVRALKGFPGVWTKIPTAKGEKRMKLITATVKNNQLELQEVQVEGKPVTRWAESKNSVVA